MKKGQKHRLLLALGILLAIALVLSSPEQSFSNVQQQEASFLQAPYYGTTSLTSIFDHDRNGGRILALTGAAAEANNCPCPDAPPGGCVDPEFALGYYSCDIHNYLYYDNHSGIDYRLRYDYVRAAAQGQVGYAGWNIPGNHGGNGSGLGLYVRINHDNGYQTFYGHMSVLRVRQNDEIPVNADEFQRILGISGSTGWSSGPHLHFEVRNANGTPVDPYGPDQNPDHELWIERPSIAPHVIYTSGDRLLTAPPINEDEPGFVTVDDGDTGFAEDPNGCWTADATDGWSGDHRWRNVPVQNPGDCTATWDFPGMPGRYNVFVYVPNNHATADAAQYTIRHTESSDSPWSKQSALARVNQDAYPNIDHLSSWVYVGTYYFDNQYGTDYVRLESQPLDSITDTMMAADAVRFAPVVYRIYLPMVTKCWPPIPDIPVLNPIDNTYSPNYLVSWQEAYLANIYTLQEATNAQFSDAVTRYSGTGTSWTAVNRPVGTTYYYRVKASNWWGDSGWSNVQSITVLPPSGWQTIATQDFEGAFPGEWRVDDNNGSDYGEYYWGKRTCRPYAGDYSGWGVGGGAQGAAMGCMSNYVDNVEGLMIYGPFNLEDTIAGELTFKLWLNVEPNNDGVLYLASTNGENFSGYLYHMSTSGNWVDATLDLADVPNLGNLLGQSQVWVAIGFSSNDTVNYAEGGYVDDVMIRKCFREPCPSGVQLTLGVEVEERDVLPPLILEQ